jgi:hypothetical protein
MIIIRWLSTCPVIFIMFSKIEVKLNINSNRFFETGFFGCKTSKYFTM